MQDVALEALVVIDTMKVFRQFRQFLVLDFLIEEVIVIDLCKNSRMQLICEVVLLDRAVTNKSMSWKLRFLPHRNFLTC